MSAKLFKVIYKIITSLKLGVPVILGMMTAMIAGTLLESIYDTATAKYWVYGAFWFKAVLIALAINITAVMVDRWPWKRRHLPFLLAHIGILLLLGGAWVTDRFGLDGMMRIEEGQTASVVEMPTQELKVVEELKIQSFDIEWTPPHARFRKKNLGDLPVQVVDFMAHADARVEFMDARKAALEGLIDLGDLQNALPALRVRLRARDQSLPMARVLGRGADFWLWAGDPGWSRIMAGPAILELSAGRGGVLGGAAAGAAGAAGAGPLLQFKVDERGGVRWSTRGKSGYLAPGKVLGQVIETGWKGDIIVEVLSYFDHAHHETVYTPAKVQWGSAAAPSAIQIQAGKSLLWLGLGDRATLSVPSSVTGGAPRELSLVYQPHRVVLPFGIKLERFNVDHYQGTANPMEYSSVVEVVDGAAVSAAASAPGGAAATPSNTSGEKIRISMNEPLDRHGITFYQASYEDAQPRPTVTILSVNRDPGRVAKYWGSIVLVSGCIFLFWDRRKKKKAVIE